MNPFSGHGVDVLQAQTSWLLLMNM